MTMEDNEPVMISASATKAPEAAPVVAEVKQEPSKVEEPKKEPTIAEKMFGDKLKAKKEADAKPPEDPSKEPEKPLEGVAPTDGSNAQQQPNKPRNRAKERIEELARERNAEREARIKADQEMERIKRELAALQVKKEEEKSSKDVMREVYLEDKFREHIQNESQQLNQYVNSLPEDIKETYSRNYNYYMPEMQKNDPNTVTVMWSYPQRYQMFDVFMQTVNKGELNLEDWYKLPAPVKYEKLHNLSEWIANPEKFNSQTTQPTTQTMQQPTPQKEVPDSIVPNLKPKVEPEDVKPPKGHYFKKIMEAGVR